MLLNIVFVLIFGLFVISIILFWFWGHSRFYKRNFPVDSISLQLMSEKDRKKLHKWVNGFVFDNQRQKYKVYEKIRRGTYDELSSFYIIDKHTEEIISSLALSIKEHRAITGELELIILNQIIYRHKYNALISMFVFPVSDELRNKVANFNIQKNKRNEVKHGL